MTYELAVYLSELLAFSIALKFIVAITATHMSDAMEQDDIFDWIEKNPTIKESLIVPEFDGETIEPEDGLRLQRQLARVYAVMRDGQARTLGEISLATGDSVQSVSARLRDFRKPKFGGYEVIRDAVKDADGKPIRGLFAYRLIAEAKAA